MIKQQQQHNFLFKSVDIATICTSHTMKTKIGRLYWTGMLAGQDVMEICSTPLPSPPRCSSHRFGRIIMYVYRETVKVKRIIPLLNSLTAPAVMSNKFWRRMVKIQYLDMGKASTLKLKLKFL